MENVFQGIHVVIFYESTEGKRRAEAGYVYPGLNLHGLSYGKNAVAIRAVKTEGTAINLAKSENEKYKQEGSYWI